MPSLRGSNVNRLSSSAVLFASVTALAALLSGCAATRGGGTALQGSGVAERIARRAVDVRDATLVGRFILEAQEGQRKGSLRIRYISPDIYRVDAFMSGVAGAGGGSSFLLRGDTTFVYAEPGARPGTEKLESGDVVPFLEDFDLLLEDLKTLAALTPYLSSMDLGHASYSLVRGGYQVEGVTPNGDNIVIWIDSEKEVVEKSLRLEPSGLPLVETKLSKFKRFGGIWRPTRVRIRHFGQNAVLAVQYDRISVNEGLRVDDVLIRSGSS